MTDAEKKLWSCLRGNQLDFKFRRQFPFGKTILDFYCHAARLNVEVDGAQHYEDQGIRNDEERDALLNAEGIKVLRYSNPDVLEDCDSIIEEISEEVRKRIHFEAEG